MICGQVRCFARDRRSDGAGDLQLQLHSADAEGDGTIMTEVAGSDTRAKTLRLSLKGLNIIPAEHEAF